MVSGQDQQDAVVRQDAIQNTGGISGLSNRAIRYGNSLSLANGPLSFPALSLGSGLVSARHTFA